MSANIDGFPLLPRSWPATKAGGGQMQRSWDAARTYLPGVPRGAHQAACRPGKLGPGCPEDSRKNQLSANACQSQNGARAGHGCKMGRRRPGRHARWPSGTGQGGQPGARARAAGSSHTWPRRREMGLQSPRLNPAAHRQAGTGERMPSLLPKVVAQRVRPARLGSAGMMLAEQTEYGF